MTPREQLDHCLDRFVTAALAGDDTAALGAFADAFARYLTDPRQGASQAVTASKPQVSPVTDNPVVTDTSVTTAGTVTALQARDLHKQPSHDGVTPRDAPPRCIGCSDPMTLIEPGQLAHPTCQPWPPSRTPSRAELAR